MAGRGRPKGYKLSQEVKDKISKTKMGQCHTAETKAKISKSLCLYFKDQRKTKFTEVLLKEYGSNKEAKAWVRDNLDIINEDALLLHNINEYNVYCMPTNDIDSINFELVDSVSVEDAVILKDYMEKYGLNEEEFDWEDFNKHFNGDELD